MKSRIVNFKRLNDNKLVQVILSHYGNDNEEEVIKHIKNYFACKHYRVLECVYDFNFGGNYICVMEDV